MPYHHAARPCKHARIFVSVLLIAGLGACKKRGSKTAKTEDGQLVADKPAGHGLVPPSAQLRSQRVVAIGDVHGDFKATKAVLALAGLIDAKGQWSGGSTILVQTGDILDRGDDEPEILELFWRLQQQAPTQGGRVELLLGNHEIMNAEGDLRYVTPGGFQDYAKTPLPPQWPNIDEGSQGLPTGYLSRKAAFVPGSMIARRFAEQKVATVVGDTVFVHGGLSLKYAKMGLDAMNQRTASWLAGKSEIPDLLKESDGPVWNRAYGASPSARACATLERSLETLGVRRMVVGHTVQAKGITSACAKQVWRIDVGMSRHYGGPIQALEIKGDRVRVISGPSTR